MYATSTIIKHSKRSGRLIGTHQRINKIARKQFTQLKGRRVKFPILKNIQYFEGANGPDGLKRKSPGHDVPHAFLNPRKTKNQKLVTQIMNHHYNLVKALKKGDDVKAAFGAAWMAHDVVDGLTPAHYYPYEEQREELLDGRDYGKFFGLKTQGFMPGDGILELLKNNWVYWGPKGMFTPHIAFEFGVAILVMATPEKVMRRMPTDEELEMLREIGFERMFYKSVRRVAKMDLYNNYLENGWSAELALEVRQNLMPELVKCVTLAWVSAYEESRK